MSTLPKFLSNTAKSEKLAKMTNHFKPEANSWELLPEGSASAGQKRFKSLSRSASLAATIPVIVILCLTSFFVFQANQTSLRTRQLQDKTKIISLNSQVFRLVVDMEGGLRGYLLTGDSRFLEPFNRSFLLLPESLNRLNDILVNQPDEQKVIEKIKVQSREWVKLADELRELRVHHGDYSNIRLNELEKTKMDVIREEFRQLRDRQFSSVQAEQNKANREAKELLWFGIGLALLFGLGLAYFFRRQFFRQLQQTLVVGQRANAILRQLKTITDVAPVAIVYVDKDEHYLFANPYYAEHFARENLIGRTVREVVKDGYDNLKPYIQRVLGGETFTFSLEVARANLPPIFVEAIYAPSFNDEGEVQGFVAISEDITERKAAEFELKRSQDSLFFALQSAQMGTWEHDIKSGAFECSDIMLAMWSIERKNWDGQVSTLLEKVHPDDQVRELASMEHAIATGEIYEAEYRVHPLPGITRWVSARGRCSYESGSSEPNMISGVTYDITDRKEREVRNAFLLKSVSAFSNTLTPSEVLETCIQLSKETFGSYSGALAVPNSAQTHLIYIPRKAGEPRVNPVMEKKGIAIDSDYATAVTFRTEKPYFVSSRAERALTLPKLPADTPVSDVEGFASLPLISEGRTIGVLKIVFNSRKVLSSEDQRALIALGDLAAQALERSQRYEETQIERDQFRAFFDLSGSGASEVDADSSLFVRVNQRFCEMMGYTPEELKHMTFLQITHPDDVQKSVEGYQKLKDNRHQHWRMEKRYLRKDGTVLWTIMSCAMIFDAAGKAIRSITTVFDITELKMAEEALKKAVSSRDQFLSIASHELKTPLTSLHLQIQLRQRDLGRTYPQGFTAERIESDLKKQFQYVQRIARLVDDILDVSRISEKKLQLHLENFDLGEMVNDVLSRFKVSADMAGVEVLFASVSHVTGRWDRFRLEQVLLNLLTNAVRYGNKKPINIQVAQVGSQATLTVSDQGIGIQSQDQSRIFERFERAISENEVSGLGLGLYIIKEIVETHQGKIEVKSEFGKGSEFTVVLPLDSGLTDSSEISPTTH